MTFASSSSRKLSYALLLAGAATALTCKKPAPERYEERTTQLAPLLEEAISIYVGPDSPRANLRQSDIATTFRISSSTIFFVLKPGSHFMRDTMENVPTGMMDPVAQGITFAVQMIPDVNERRSIVVLENPASLERPSPIVRYLMERHRARLIDLTPEGINEMKRAVCEQYMRLPAAEYNGQRDRLPDTLRQSPAARGIFHEYIAPSFIAEARLRVRYVTQSEYNRANFRRVAAHEATHAAVLFHNTINHRLDQNGRCGRDRCTEMQGIMGEMAYGGAASKSLADLLNNVHTRRSEREFRAVARDQGRRMIINTQDIDDPDRGFFVAELERRLNLRRPTDFMFRTDVEIEAAARAALDAYFRQTYGIPFSEVASPSFYSELGAEIQRHLDESQTR